ncbi:DUF805 domain-containing protein [Sphingomonas sp. IC081]|uniref:DUF805 domain-containing protein n=1 Tax=Sphingomonas sp. IC081 TaxID=304378 RepID=UPI0011649051|nr:DUF805 domain-containing protein [Sphingomonas sp. IC081]QDK33999.1 DUF805 domain-containing protein [Sphingomonas sp. IC081]
MIDEEALRSIEKLHQMKQEGIISESDFDAAKQDILKGRARPKTKSPRPNIYTHPETKNDQLPDDGQFIEWLILPLKRYADFTGRSGRQEYWLFQAAAAVITFAFLLSVIDLGSGSSILVAGSSGLALIGLIVPQVALQVRRFHDQDKPGWFVLLNLVPYVGPVIVLVFMLLRGTPWENRYGPNPYDQ